MTVTGNIVTDTLAQPLADISQEQAIRWLSSLHDWYASQERACYEKLWGAERDWSEGKEREWDRYRMEAAALRLAMEKIAEEKPCPDCGGEGSLKKPWQVSCWRSRHQMPFIWGEMP